MKVLKTIVPARLKTAVKQMPVVRPWLQRKDILRRYDDIVNRTQSFQMLSNVEDLAIAEIEINRNCNINCVMCNTSLSQRPQFNMDLGLFEHAVKYAKTQGNGYTSLHTIGEPLMNKNLPRYFEILRNHNVQVVFSTNGLLLHKHLDLLIDNADVITDLRFSIDGASKESYEKIRRGGSWERLIANMEMLRSKTKPGETFRQVRISSIVSEDVRHELGYHMQFWSRYAPIEQIDLNLVSGLSPDNTYFLERSILKNHIMAWPPCYMLFSPTLHILNDGRVTACCRDYNGDLVFGDIRESSPRELVNCENVLELRRQQLEKRIPDNSLCANCLCINPIVSQLFKLFVSRLVRRFSNSWDVFRMQARFEEFFEEFAAGIPDRTRFSALIRA